VLAGLPRDHQLCARAVRPDRRGRDVDSLDEALARANDTRSA
jgi:hypothetical protein